MSLVLLQGGLVVQNSLVIVLHNLNPSLHFYLIFRYGFII